MSVRNPELPKPCFVRVICTGDLAAMFILKLRALTSTCHKHERARRVSRSRVAEPLDDRVLGVTVGSVIWVLDSIVPQSYASFSYVGVDHVFLPIGSMFSEEEPATAQVSDESHLLARNVLRSH